MTFTLWLTGVPAAGKTTLAAALEEELLKRSLPVQRLDSDELPPSILKKLPACSTSRETIAKILALSASLLNRHGIVCIVACTTPHAITRKEVSDLVKNYIEVFVCCPQSLAEKRDPKGLYKMSRIGLLSDFTGVSSDYEVPADPAISVDTSREDIPSCLHKIMSYLEIAWL